MSSPPTAEPDQAAFDVLTLRYDAERREAVVMLQDDPSAGQGIRLDGTEAEFRPQYVMIKNQRRGFWKIKITGVIEVVCGAKGEPPQLHIFAVEPGQTYAFTCYWHSLLPT
jgi:hypothetical protein